MTMDKDLIKEINTVASEFFEANKNEKWIAAKKLMPPLVSAGVFNKDVKNGQPLRKVLRELDKESALDQIPLLHAERSEETIYWYFVREGEQYVSADATGINTKKGQAKAELEGRDESYVIGLCDQILDEVSTKQHTFSFLLGDFHKDGFTRTKLPVNAFYSKSNLVILFADKQLNADFEASEKASKITSTGVTRSEQKQIYDQRKTDLIIKNEINLLHINSSMFACGPHKGLLRETEKDMVVLNKALATYL